MRSARLVTGVTAGIIPAAATTGMLLGFGIRLGAPARVFQGIGTIIAGPGVSGVSTSPTTTLLGILLNIAATLTCGVVYASLVGESRDHRVAWAIAVSAAAVASAFVGARTLAGSIALVLTPGNLVAIGVVIAITLPIGMRFAPSRV